MRLEGARESGNIINVTGRQPLHAVNDLLLKTLGQGVVTNVTAELLNPLQSFFRKMPEQVLTVSGGNLLDMHIHEVVDAIATNLDFEKTFNSGAERRATIIRFQSNGRLIGEITVHNPSYWGAAKIPTPASTSNSLQKLWQAKFTASDLPWKTSQK